MFFLAAHTGHCANVQRQVPDQLARGQLVHLQDVLHVMDVVDQQVVLVEAGDKACRGIQRGSGNQHTHGKWLFVLPSEGDLFPCCLPSSLCATTLIDSSHELGMRAT